MNYNLNETKKAESPNNKAQKVLELNEEIRAIKIKRRTIMRAFTEEAKRLESELESILAGEETPQEIVQKVADVHDWALVK